MPRLSKLLSCFALSAFWVLCHPAARAQEAPYLVTYSDVLEEPGNLELATQDVLAAPHDANDFAASTLELEYGVTGWWTTELYLQGQSTAHDSTVFTGFRLENRFKPLRGAHWINPVLYLEYEDISRADKSFLEITGYHAIQDLQVPNAFLRAEVERSLEAKLILSSYLHGFNLSENFIAEKNLSNEPWEFGYALAASRPLANAAPSHTCRLCRENFAAGAELFGGLGTRYTFGFRGTQLYAGPTLAYSTPQNWTVLAGPEFGLDANAATVLFRFKISREFNQVRDLFRSQR